MPNQSASEFLISQIPVKHQVLLSPAVRTAYAAARILMEASPVYQMPSAQDNRGRFVSWCVEFAIMALIRSGKWPADFEWQEYGLIDSSTGLVRKGTGHYLVVKLPGAQLTINQVDDPRKQPRDVKFRQNARLANQPLLDGWEIAEDPEQGLPVIHLNHGHRELNFLHLGMPNPEHKRGYAFRSDNLLLLPHEVASDTTRVEQTDFDEAAITLKADIEKWRKDHAG
jgi:hypothetical protein